MLVKLKPDQIGNVKPDPARRGIEKYLIMNKDTPQTDKTSWKGKIITVLRAIGLIKPDLKASEKAVHKYIDALIDALIVRLKEANPPQKSVEIGKLEKLGKLLRDMTMSNPILRPTMKIALEQYKKLGL